MRRCFASVSFACRLCEQLKAAEASEASAVLSAAKAEEVCKELARKRVELEDVQVWSMAMMHGRCCACMAMCCCARHSSCNLVWEE
jgi:hypothetical protein